MTGYTVHTGSNENFSQGWDEIFGKGAGAKKKSAVKPADKSAKKAAAAKASKKAPTKKSKKK